MVTMSSAFALTEANRTQDQGDPAKDYDSSSGGGGDTSASDLPLPSYFFLHAASLIPLASFCRMMHR